jgi:UDP-N-acetylmuramoyl-L-alanyl-D-glutamate--2,6-diaminopimelate ligase
MKWEDVISTTCVLDAVGSQDVEVFGVHHDSRRVTFGDVFVALRGGTTDGNDHINCAIRKGAVAVVTDSRSRLIEISRALPGLSVALVANGRRALAEISAKIFDQPQKRILLSAITGTNGKTTTSYLLEQILQGVGRRCVLLGTIENHVAGEIRKSDYTTPEIIDVISVLSEGVQRGCSEAIMEMSSHGLSQERVWGLQLDLAIFTNLTQDHLDYHGTMEMYAQSKERIFVGLGAPAPRVAIINADDEAAERMLAAAVGCEVIFYGISAGTWQAVDVTLKVGLTTFCLRTPIGEVFLRSPLTGQVNIYNLIAAACAAYARGCNLEQIASATKFLRQVPGRFEEVPAPQDLSFTVFVDYAHTEDALKNLIAVAYSLTRERGGQVITMFGCGGGRDRSKRPKMGVVAGSGSDLVVVTSDNPRSETPLLIIEEVMLGVGITDAAFIVEEDRHAAIGVAVYAAKQGDVVLLAGKGHEKKQILSNGAVMFDDVEKATLLLNKLHQEVLS